MNVTFDYLTGNRKWLVRDYVVWGDSGSLDSAIIATENNPSSNRLIVFRELCGAAAQVVEFADLVDHRGNTLPASISNAEIIIIPKNEVGSFVVGSIGTESFRLAKLPESEADALVDLLIMEMN
jgi:hypothetical protein